MANPSYTYTLTNGTTADASQVMQNFNDILNGVTDGTKDLSISALTVAGTATLNGNINLGNASGDDLTITASLASSLPIKTNNSYDIGSATLGLRKLYLGNAGAGATADIVSASHATTREYTVPDCSAAANFVMTEATQTINGAKTFSSSPTFSAGFTSSGLATINARILSNYSTETSGQAYTTQQQNISSGGTFAFTPGGNSGICIAVNCNSGEIGLFTYSTATTVLIGTGTGWAAGTGAGTNNKLNASAGVLTATNNNGGTRTYAFFCVSMAQ